MVNAIIPIPGYVHLYRSLLRFYDMPENEVREMLYLLNTANLDCYEYYHPERDVIQSGPVAFSNWLEHMNCRPYRTQRVPDARLDLPSQRIMPGTLYKFVPNNRQNSGQFIFKGGMPYHTKGSQCRI